ncbi:hypothetical protein [Sphingobium amiense]|uniref:hypothetical protein n=1 Tax=Sphingobium amiense TaxID=135719 RepID=UPI000F84CBAD|nr:hypothetical protein [Sphingobium amiense]
MSYLYPENTRADWWIPGKVDLMAELGKSWASTPDYFSTALILNRKITTRRYLDIAGVASSAPCRATR